MPTIRLLIKGKVQGVFYRASAKSMAEKTGVGGWVKNTKEGDVEIHATGTEAQLQAFTEWCRRGPSNACVTDVVITAEDEAPFEAFHIKR
jgi:acylphosphatase